MESIRIEQAGPDDAPRVLELVAALLRELGEEGDDTGELGVAELSTAWRAAGPCHWAFLALTEDGEAVGVATLASAFAFYAQGEYGAISEMYVVPEYRSQGVGALLVDAVKDFARQLEWRRIDVTAPESERWMRTQRFYEQQGFVFTGPKLKFGLTDG